jgi:hypothetical protein
MPTLRRPHPARGGAVVLSRRWRPRWA